MTSSTPLYVVLGATGITGMFCCRELLQKGGNVRAVMRETDKAKAELEDMITYFPRGKRGKLEIVKGDVTKPEEMRAAMEGAKVVIFAATGNNFSGVGSSYDVDNLGVGVAAEAAKAAGVQKFVLCSCAVVTEKNPFAMTRFWMNVSKWHFMDNKLAGERLLRQSGLPYSIVRLGNLYLSHNGTGGEYKLRVGQGDQISGILSRADAAAVACACAMDPVLALNSTFEIAQNEFFEEYNDRDEAGSRWEILQYLKPDTDTGSVSVGPDADPPRSSADGAPQPAAGPSQAESKGAQPPKQQPGWFGIPNPLAQLPALQIPALPFLGDKGGSRACRWLSSGKPSWQPTGVAGDSSKAAPASAEAAPAVAEAAPASASAVPGSGAVPKRASDRGAPPAPTPAPTPAPAPEPAPEPTHALETAASEPRQGAAECPEEAEEASTPRHAGGAVAGDAVAGDA